MTDIERISKEIEKILDDYYDRDSILFEKPSSIMASWILSCVPEEKEHSNFCSALPEWYTLETNGACDCKMGVWNRCRAELLRRLGGGK